MLLSHLIVFLLALEPKQFRQEDEDEEEGGEGGGGCNRAIMGRGGSRVPILALLARRATDT